MNTSNVINPLLDKQDGRRIFNGHATIREKRMFEDARDYLEEQEDADVAFLCQSIARAGSFRPDRLCDL